MNPQCARCQKTVYPTEKLNCLDKYWHKLCFKCETCNMQLNMKNYKGYNKLPYCNTHYPTTKFTAVADTPENKRLAANTKKQSNIEYHKDFEAGKGRYTAVADDPEMVRNQKAAAMRASVGQVQRAEEQDRGYSTPPARPTMNPPPSHPVPVPVPDQQPPAPQSGPSYKALYDYTAADDDEVSVNEGDIIIDVNIIDAGWLEGRNQRTGQFGMLPLNYVEAM